MHQLSNTVDRKFTEIIDLDEWEIETPSGWKDITTIMQTVEYDVWRVEFEDELWIEGADNHILMKVDDSECFIKDLVPGDKIQSINISSVVKSVHQLPRTENMYDVEVDSNEHVFYSNGLVSHNTTTVGAFLLHQVVFNRHLTIGILANKGDTAKGILARIKDMFEYLPWFLKPGVVEWNKTSIELSNGSRMVSAATSAGGVRSYSMNIVYLDEFAHVQNDVEFFTSTYPVISSGETTRVIITSTPNGMNLFYKMWSEAKSGKSLFVPKEFLWYRHPNRGEKWKEETLRNISQKQFDQEYNCLFLGSSNTLISGQKLTQLTFEDPIRVDNDLKIYKEPEEAHSYVITVDTSEGIGKDSSVISVFDITSSPYEHIAVYRSNTILPLLLAAEVFKIATMYNQGFVVVETNNVGKIVADALYYDYEYENLVMGGVTDSENVVTSKTNSNPGIRTTKKTKSIGCSTFKSMLESDTLLVKDFETIGEICTFVKVGTSYEAEKNKNDDIVMTLIFFCWFASQPYFEELTDINMREHIKDNYLRVAEMNHLVFGFRSDGTEEYENDDMKMIGIHNY